MASAPVVIDYAMPMSENIDPRAAASATPLLGLAILSPCCVAVCFLPLATEMHPMSGMIHLLVFAATLAVAGLAGMRMRTPGEGISAREILDMIAGAGLLMLALAPLAYNAGLGHDDKSGPGMLGIAYGLMTVTTARHLMLYRMLAEWSRSAGRPGLAKSLVALGWTKAVYEFVWLSCCAIVLLGIPLADGSSTGDILIPIAIAALLGCFGFGAIAAWMIVIHALLRGATIPRFTTRYAQ